MSKKVEDTKMKRNTELYPETRKYKTEAVDQDDRINSKGYNMMSSKQNNYVEEVENWK